MTTSKLTRKEIKEKIEDGWVHVNIIFEMVGSPKEHIEKSMDAFLANIAGDDQITMLSEDREETIEVEDSKGLFSAAAEVEYLVYGIDKLTYIAFNFMPASIEIKAPKEMTFRDKDLTGWFGDMLAKLHEVNSVHAAVKGENKQLILTTNTLIRNNILLALEGEMTAKEIAGKVGMKEEHLLPFLEAMVKELRLEHKGKKFWKTKKK